MVTRKPDRRPHVALVYPHQLFPDHPSLRGPDRQRVVLVEDPLFFKEVQFHRLKLVLHRATMQRFAAEQRSRGHAVEIVEADELASSADIGAWMARHGVASAAWVDPCDDWLSRRVQAGCRAAGIALTVLPDPHFLTPLQEIAAFADGREKLFFTEFYIRQRKRLGLLLEKGDKPRGGQWSFDRENRRKLPKGLSVPRVSSIVEDDFVREAKSYVTRRFPQALGHDPMAPVWFPTSRAQSLAALDQFVDERLPLFGDYEDAINRRETFLFHSALTPALNVGLLSPREVLDAAIARADADPDAVPLNALEGFVRQVAGWREFVRLVYITHGRRQRTTNYWDLSRTMPQAFYDGTTGIDPVDHVIKRVLTTGYCHHIERLMVLGAFLLLCDVRPDDVYRWFMELFVDAYDWVMVPNVYGMSQYADGGLMTTKPYICGSSYILKMSDFPRGPWCAVWDALYWRFVDRHRDFFASSPRMAVMAKQLDRLGDRLAEHHRIAEAFLARLHAAT